jgi:hypothetical protein
MSTLTEGTGPALPVLDQMTLASLPAYLSEDERASLGAPRDALALAVMAAGRLLRSGDGRAGARRQIVRWLGLFERAAVRVLGATAEQQGVELVAALRSFAGRNEEAGDALRRATERLAAASADGRPAPAGAPEGEERAEPSPPGERWFPRAIEQRDDLESVLVVLGVLALEHPDPSISEEAALQERQACEAAEAVDRLVRLMAHVLGDELGPDAPSPWLARIQALQSSRWWLAMLEARRVDASVGGRRGVAQVATRVPALDNVIAVVFRRPDAERRLAAHGGAEGAPAPSGEQTEGRHEQLTFTVEERPSEEGGSHVVLRIYGRREAPVDFLAAQAVTVTDERGVARPAVEEKGYEQRWWGVFRGSGLFVVQIAGLARPFAFRIARPEA